MRTEIATANTVLIVHLKLGACAHARHPDVNNPPSSQFEGFLSPNASVSCSAPALNATTTSSLTLTKAWLAIAIHKQACQVPPPPEISCVSQTVSASHYAVRCLLGDGRL